MMRQYKRIKEQHPNSVLLFRMGDFYEMFYRDAEEVSRLLNLTLTKRQGVPMAGIPYHALQNYLRRLLQAGKRTAICEQTEPPNKPGLTKREVVEVVSPGTILHQDLLENSTNNYLQAFGQKGAFLGMALLDFSTGEFHCESFHTPDAQTKAEVLGRELLLAASRELLIMEPLHEEFSDEFWAQGAQNASSGGKRALLCNRIPSWCFTPDSAERKLCQFFDVQSLKGFGINDEPGIALGAAWVVLEYLQQNQTQSRVLAHVRRLLPLRRTEHLQLDSAALRNLEIFQNIQSGSQDHTLFQTLHQCQSPMGSRCLQHWLREPLRQKTELERRYEKIETLLGDGMLRSSIRENLGRLCDLERITSRIATAKANARDLVALRDSLALCEMILQTLQNLRCFGDMLQSFEPNQAAQEEPSPKSGRARLLELQTLLQKALLDHPPVVLHEGGMIQTGYSRKLDELRSLHGERKEILDGYVAREQEQIGSIKLKLKYNRLIGYHFEITKTQLAQIELPKHFISRQTITNNVRYSTEELAELEERLNHADEQLTRLERQLFEELLEQIQPDIPAVLQLSQVVSQLDVLSCFAEISKRYNYVRPRLREPGAALHIEGGRHPVVEQYLQEQDFVPNNLQLDNNHFLALITGPNMAGKSTYLRQNALIVLLAQIGCFVPASCAHIPLVDQIFCRVGASDNLSRGESTFMVEMQETARILNTASEHSLVIMDEVGRGTSTRDGLAIAQSICEYLLHKIRCKTLFATHYHELTRLSERHLKLLCLAVKESGQQIHFLKHVQEGAIESSYGIHVASLAGVPPEVTQRANEILDQMSSIPAMPTSHISSNTEQPINTKTDLAQNAQNPEEPTCLNEAPHPLTHESRPASSKSEKKGQEGGKAEPKSEYKNESKQPDKAQRHLDSDKADKKSTPPQTAGLLFPDLPDNP